MVFLNIGINLYPNMLGYDYIFELADKFSVPSIRTSYVAPTCSFSNVNKDEYYTNAKDIFLPFVEKAKSMGLRIRLDCNHIPICYFTDKEKELMNGVVEGWKYYCEPVVDITPDFKATACFGAYELFDLDMFENIDQVERYLRYKKLYLVSEANGSGGCSDCDKYKNLSCQGGCLAFANK